MHRRAFLAGTASAGLALSSGCLSASPFVGTVAATDSRVIGVEPGTAVAVDNGDGRVDVGPATGNEVELTVELEGPSEDALEDSTVTVEQDDGRLEIEVEAVETSFLYDDVTTDVDVRLPDGVPLDRVDTSNGAVEVVDVGGDPDLSTTNGPVTAIGVDGAVSAASTNGPIEARDNDGVAELETTNGSIDVDLPAITAQCELTTTNGPIDAALAPDLDVDIRAETTNGSIEVHGLSVEILDRDDDELAARLGDGIDDLHVETTNGSIDLRALE